MTSLPIAKGKSRLQPIIFIGKIMADLSHARQKLSPLAGGCAPSKPEPHLVPQEHSPDLMLTQTLVPWTWTFHTHCKSQCKPLIVYIYDFCGILCLLLDIITMHHITIHVKCMWKPSQLISEEISVRKSQLCMHMISPVCPSFSLYT